MKGRTGMFNKGMQDMLIHIVKESLGGIDLQGLVRSAQEEYSVNVKSRLDRIEQNQETIIKLLEAKNDHDGSNYGRAQFIGSDPGRA